MTQQSHSWDIFRENHNFKRYQHPSVHRGTIYNSQDIETNLNVRQQRNESRRRGRYVLWIMTQPSKESNNAIWSNMEVLEIIILSQVNQEDRNKYTTLNLKYDTNQRIYETETYS